jgi:hypothetical protein
MKRWTKEKPGDWDDYKVRAEVVIELGFSSYQDYLASELWSGIRNAVMDRDCKTCGICRRPATHVHHLRYTKTVLLGLNLDQLVCLCARCHKRLEFKPNGRKTSPVESCYLFNRRRKKVAAKVGQQQRRRKRQERKRKGRLDRPCK